MDQYEKNSLRNARNSYNSSVQAAKGFVSGKRLYHVRQDEKRLRELLWKHRDYIVDTITDKQ